MRTLSGERPPALRFISIAINRGGRIDTKGLPLCRRSQIEASTSARALQTCGDALVGSGRYKAGVSFPEQETFPLQGRILAFNARIDGQRAILAHIYGNKPYPNSRIFVFHIRKSQGTYRDRPHRRPAEGDQPQRLPEADRPQPAARLHLPGQEAQLSDGGLRGAGGLTGSGCSRSCGSG